VNNRQAIISILSSRFSGYNASRGNFIPKIIPSGLSVPNFARSDYDASGKNASGYEVSGFDATIKENEYNIYLLACK